jgi:carbamoyl-phosphate synthase large subunit
VHEELQQRKANSLFVLRDALLLGISIEEIYSLTKVDRWFLYQLNEIVALETELRTYA